MCIMQAQQATVSFAVQQRGLLGRAHDIDQRDAVSHADLLQHVPELRRRGGVYQPGALRGAWMAL
jgi:hypothetical protein